MLACLPTDEAWRRTRDAYKTSARRPGPTAFVVVVGILVILGVGATPRTTSAPWNAQATAQDQATSHNPEARLTRAALPAPARHRARHAAAPRPPEPQHRPADQTPTNPGTGTQRARWSIASIVTITAILLARPYLASAADHRHGSHQRHHRHDGGGAADAARVETASHGTHDAPATGASDQPLDVYPHPRAQQSEDMVTTSRDANARGEHAARGGAHAARARRSGSRIYIIDNQSTGAGNVSASDGDAGGSDSDADARASDKEVNTLPLHALGCGISAVDAPHDAYMSPDAGEANDARASASAAATHGHPKRRRVQPVVTHHQAVSLAITVWRLVRDHTGVYYTKDEVIAVHVGLHLRGAFLLAPLTSPRGQILCMVMATHYARLFRHLPHAVVLSRYTSHHVAIRNGTGATRVGDISAGVRWLAEQFQDDPHHIGSGNSDCTGRLHDGSLAAAAILDATTNHIRGISNTHARGTDHVELVAAALGACDYFGEPRIQAALRDWRAEQPDDRPPSPGARATATAAPATVTPARPEPGPRAADDDDGSPGARPEGARAASAAPLPESLAARLRTSTASPGGGDPDEPEPHRSTPRRQSTATPAPKPPPAPLPPMPAAAAAAAPGNVHPEGAADDDNGGDTEEEQI